MWSNTHFPAAMRSLNPSTREKAIEIANFLITNGEVDKAQAVVISIAEARRLARQARVVNEPTPAYSYTRRL